jgi:hypothetical protein
MKGWEQGMGMNHVGHGENAILMLENYVARKEYIYTTQEKGQILVTC